MNKVLYKLHKLQPQKSRSAQKQVNHSELTQRLTLRARRQQESSPIKKFQEYFGKVKPAFFRQLRNIFQKSQFLEQMSTTKQVHYDHTIKSMSFTTRNRIFNRNKYSINQANNFTIKPINQEQLYRKAKLNKLVQSYNKHATIDQPIREQKSLDNNLTINHIKGKTIEQYKQDRLQKFGRITVRKKQNFLELISPNNKQKFTNQDLSHILSHIHRVNIQISSHFYYFNVYIEEGNNSDLLKNIVRKRTGWRIVQIPDNANLIWTQFYKKSVLQKRLHKIQQVEMIEQPKPKEKYVSSFRSKVLSISKKPAYEKYESQYKMPENQNYKNQVKKLFTKHEYQRLYSSKSNLLNTKKNVQITHNILFHNHFPENHCISDKKNLLFYMKTYMETKGKDVFQIIPQSYELTSETIDVELMNKLDAYNYWLIKPGENSNRGRGIIITHSKTQTIEQITKKFNQDYDKEKPRLKVKPKSLILQKYIIPFLYNNRKIDIRSYMLVTVINKQLRMYCYEQCYIRTSCKTFDINSSNKYVHLTNDAIQTNSNEYGKYEQGNKLSQTIFSRYIDEQYARSNNGLQGSIWQKLKEQMKQRCVQIIEASHQALIKNIYNKNKIDLQMHEEQRYYFELFGMDFMIDEQYKLWLIQVNTNPSIVHDCSKILNNLIPRMLENTLFVAVQPFMKPIRFHDIHIHNQYVALYKKHLK